MLDTNPSHSLKLCCKKQKPGPSSASLPACPGGRASLAGPPVPQYVPAHQLGPQAPHVPVVQPLPPAGPVQDLDGVRVVAVPAVLVHAREVDAPQQKVEAVQVGCLAVAPVHSVSVVGVPPGHAPELPDQVIHLALHVVPQAVLLPPLKVDVFCVLDGVWGARGIVRGGELP